jgi:hypothetical protein
MGYHNLIVLAPDATAIGFQVSGKKVQGSGFRVQRLKSEPQNRRMSNVESSSGGQVSKEGIPSII